MRQKSEYVKIQWNENTEHSTNSSVGWMMDGYSDFGGVLCFHLRIVHLNAGCRHCIQKGNIIYRSAAVESRSACKVLWKLTEC